MKAQNTVGILVACIILPIAAAVGPNGPTQQGAPADCISWYSAKDGDTVIGIARTHGIPLAAFMDANPQLSGNPLALWRGYDYCVPQESNTVSPTGTRSRLSVEIFVEIADVGYKPPTQIPSEAPIDSESGPSPQEPSYPEQTGSSGKEYSPTFQSATGTGGPMQPANGTGYFPVYGPATNDVVPDSPTGGRSGKAAEPQYTPTSTKDAPAGESTEVESSHTDESTSSDIEETSSIIQKSSATSEDSAVGSPSTSSAQSSTSAQSATGSQPSSESQPTTSSQSTADPQSNTSIQSSAVSQTTANSQSSKSSESATASPGSGSNSGGSTMTTSIVAPTTSQSGGQTATENGGQSSANDLAPSFGAAPKDVKRVEAIEPRNKVQWHGISGNTYGLVEETVSSDGKEWTTSVTVWKARTKDPKVDVEYSNVSFDYGEPTQAA